MEDSRKFIEIIEKIVMDILKKFRRNQPTTWNAKVVTASVAPNAMASVYIDGDTSATITLKNITPLTLVANNECVAFSPTSNLSNAVILYKK